MKKRNKKFFIVLFIFSIIAVLLVIYKLREKQTIELIFENAVIDIPEDTPEANQLIHTLEKKLAHQMPECRITKLYIDNQSPLIQRYEKKGEEVLLLQMDFYIMENSETGPLIPYQQYEGYTWTFTRKNTNDKWSLISWGYF